jgi:hypothetical protein
MIIEAIQLGEDLVRDIIWEHTNKNWSLIMESITDTDNDSYTKEYVVRRNNDGRYFRFELMHCDQLDISHPNLNTFPISAINVKPKVITSIVFE